MFEAMHLMAPQAANCFVPQTKLNYKYGEHNNNMMRCHIPVSDTQAVPQAPHQFLACNKTQYGKLGNDNMVN